MPPPTQTVMNNPLFISQTGANSNVIPNYGTINMTIQQQFAAMPSFGGNFYVPVRVSREYYNINRSDTFNNGLHFVDKSIDCEQYRDVFYSIFEAMNQEQHFRHMMEETE